MPAGFVLGSNTLSFFKHKAAIKMCFSLVTNFLLYNKGKWPDSWISYICDNNNVFVGVTVVFAWIPQSSQNVIRYPSVKLITTTHALWAPKARRICPTLSPLAFFPLQFVPPSLSGRINTSKCCFCKREGFRALPKQPFLEHVFLFRQTLFFSSTVSIHTTTAILWAIW